MTFKTFKLFILFTTALNAPFFGSLSAYAATLNEVAIYQPEATFTAYLEKDVRILEEKPVILRPGQYLKSGDLYLVDAAAAGGSSHVYLELVVDWIEPIELSAAVDEIRVSSLIGTADAILPGNGAEEAVALNVGQTIPVGSVIRVGKEGCVGLDIGGRHAVCLVPGSVATINRDTSSQTDQIAINLDSGAVFSHVNLKGEPTDFRVKTTSAIAAARGTDFVTVALEDVTDVWIQEGTVELLKPDGSSVGTVSSDHGGSPKIMRFPPAPDELARIKANSLTFTAAATLIPQLNVQLPKIREKQAEGEALTDLEQNILNNVQKMHALIKVEALAQK